MKIGFFCGESGRMWFNPRHRWVAIRNPWLRRFPGGIGVDVIGVGVWWGHERGLK